MLFRCTCSVCYPGMSPTLLTVGYVLRSRSCLLDPQAGRARVATHPSVVTRAVLSVAHAQCPGDASACLVTLAPTARSVCSYAVLLVKSLVMCFCIEPVAEGLSVQFTSTSSLVKVADYQNASIYLDLSSNSAFSGYKVWFAPAKLRRTSCEALIFIQVSILPYNPGSNSFPVELSDWNKRSITPAEASLSLQ